MTQLSISRNLNGPAAVDARRASTGGQGNGPVSSPTWTRREAVTTDAGASAAPRRQAEVLRAATVAHRAVSSPGEPRQPSAPEKRSPVAAESPEATPDITPKAGKDGLPFLAPVKLAVTLAVMWFKLLHRVSSNINNNVQALEHDPRNHRPHPARH